MAPQIPAQFQPAKRWLASRRAFAVLNRSDTITGTPPGLDSVQFDEVVTEFGGFRPQSIAHQHLSGWKDDATYRIEARGRRTNRFSAIFRQASATDEAHPAHLGLPITPGPGEYEVHKASMGTNDGLFPNTYRCHRDENGYWLLVEDVRLTHRPAQTSDLPTVAGSLPAVHEYLETLNAGMQIDVPTYGQEFSQALSIYVDDALVGALGNGAPPAWDRVRDRWADIRDIHSQDSFRSAWPRQLIHGDLNASNILVARSRRSDRPLVVVDWEWTGLGVAQSDLAAAIKAAPTGIENQALDQYRTSLTDQPEDLSSRIEWCRLERALWDLGFWARLAQDSGANSYLDRVGSAARRTLRFSSASLDEPPL